MSEHPERRRFIRIGFDAPSELRQGDHCWEVELLDLSLKGLMIKRPAQWNGDITQAFEARIKLDDREHMLMQVELRHEEPEKLGFICQSVDIDSLTHLRNLVEHNLADRTELEREFHQLIEV